MSLEDVPNLINEYTDKFSIIPLMKVSFQKEKDVYAQYFEEEEGKEEKEKEDYTPPDMICQPTEYGYVHDNSHPYTSTFQSKFFMYQFGKPKWSEKDLEYLKYIYTEIYEMAFRLWVFNIYRHDVDTHIMGTDKQKDLINIERVPFKDQNLRIELMKKLCPSLIHDMNRYNEFKYGELSKRIAHMKINSPQSDADFKLQFLVEKNFLTMNTLVPMSDPYCNVAYEAANTLKGFISLLGRFKDDLRMRFYIQKIIAILLFPFLIPQDLIFSVYPINYLDAEYKPISSTEANERFKEMIRKIFDPYRKNLTTSTWTHPVSSPFTILNEEDLYKIFTQEYKGEQTDFGINIPNEYFWKHFRPPAKDYEHISMETGIFAPLSDIKF